MFPLEYLAFLENGYCYENSTVPSYIVVTDRECIVWIKFSLPQEKKLFLKGKTQQNKQTKKPQTHLALLSRELP